MTNITNKPRVIITLAPSSVPDVQEFVEYSIDMARYHALPIWEPESSCTNAFPTILEKVIAIGEKDVISRYGASSKKMFLESVDFRRIPNQRESRWYFTISFKVNLTSRPFVLSPSECKTMISIVLMDGSVVSPMKTELSESFEMVIPDNNGIVF